MERGKSEQKLPIQQIQSGTNSPLHVGSFNQIPSLPPLLPLPSNPLPPLLDPIGLQIPLSPGPQNFSLAPASQTRCTACGLGFAEKDQLVAHLKLHLPAYPSNFIPGVAPFVCVTCSLSFPKTEDLTAHMLSHHSPPGNGMMGAPSSPGSSLPLSPSNMDSSKENGSPFLGNRFKGNNLQQKIPKGGPGEKPFVCEKCGKAFSQKGNLSTHIRDTHTNPSGVACPICGKKLKNKNSLKVHIRTHSDTLPFICTADDCGKRFNQKCSLVIHQRIHTGEKPYTCSCGKKFRSSSNCAAHKRSHTGEGCIPCNVCGKKFGSRSRYISHSRTHTGEKPFQCQICDKRFTEKSSRSKHMRIHSRDKPFACHFCEKKFRLKRGLNSHLRTHTNDMPFACHMCGRTYRHKVSLTKHSAKCDEKSGEHAREQRERGGENHLISSPGGGPPLSPSGSPSSLPLPPPSLPHLPELNLVSNSLGPGPGDGSLLPPGNGGNGNGGGGPMIGTLPSSRIPPGLSLPGPRSLGPGPGPGGGLGGVPPGPMNLHPTSNMNNGGAHSPSGIPGRLPPMTNHNNGSNNNPLLAGGGRPAMTLNGHRRPETDSMLPPGMPPYPPPPHLGLPPTRFGLPPDRDPPMYAHPYPTNSHHSSHPPHPLKRHLEDPSGSLSSPQLATNDNHILRMNGPLSLPSSPGSSGSLSHLNVGSFEPPLKHQRTDLHLPPLHLGDHSLLSSSRSLHHHSPPSSFPPSLNHHPPFAPAPSSLNRRNMSPLDTELDLDNVGDPDEPEDLDGEGGDTGELDNMEDHEEDTTNSPPEIDDQEDMNQSIGVS